MSHLAVRTKKNYWKGDYDKITTELSEISWNEELRDKSAESMWLTFKQMVGVLSDLHIPPKKTHQKKKGHWISKNTRKEMKKRSKAWHKYRSFRSSSNYEAYKSVRNKVTSLIRADENAYRKKLLQDFKGNPRRFYRHMRNLQTVKDNVTALKTKSGELHTIRKQPTL